MDNDRLLYETAEKAVRLSDASRPKSASTRRAYTSDWRHFVLWCHENGLDSLPAKPSSIARYVDYLARPGDGAKPSKPATISRRLCSINAAHKAAQLDSPATVNESQLSETMHDLRQAFATPTTNTEETFNARADRPDIGFLGWIHRRGAKPSSPVDRRCRRSRKLGLG